MDYIKKSTERRLKNMYIDPQAVIQLDKITEMREYSVEITVDGIKGTSPRKVTMVKISGKWRLLN